MGSDGQVGGHVYLSIDSAETWLRLNNGTNSLPTTCEGPLVWSNLQPGRVWLWCTLNGVNVSDDSGMSWQSLGVPAEIALVPVQELFISDVPGEPDSVLLGCATAYPGDPRAMRFKNSTRNSWVKLDESTGIHQPQSAQVLDGTPQTLLLIGQEGVWQ